MISKIFQFPEYKSNLMNMISKIIQTPDSTVFRHCCYAAGLTPAQKADLDAYFADDNTLKIAFKQYPNFDFTIRRQNIFNSGAKIIVNAANTHLGGGGGIDGAIHREGGKDYEDAHEGLRKLYNSSYVQGHAAMIESGLLRTKYQIDNVIVVAGPQGETDAQKESELYSCYYNSLILADSERKESIAFPSISTGIFGFPKDRAALTSLRAVYDFVNQYPNTTLKRVSIHFLPSDPKQNLEIYQAIIGKGS
jgi:O-acetyl-ADP-ribose deacetylase (regulator of RNase III)